MMATIPIAAFLLAAAAPAELVPDRAMLDAFRAACEQVDDLDRMREDARRGGWQPIADTDDPRIERLNRMGRESTGEGSSTIVSHRATIGGRELFLIVSRWEGVGEEEGLWGNGCRLYDFAATDSLDPQMLEQWMGRAPTGVEDFGELGGRRLWEPGWRLGLGVDVSHVPHGSALTDRLGFGGNVLVAQAIGGF